MVVNYDKINNQWTGIIPSIVSARKELVTFNDETESFITTFKGFSAGMNSDGIDKLAADLRNVDQEVVKSAKGFSQSGQSIEQWENSVRRAQVSSSNFGNTLKFLGGILANMAIAAVLESLIALTYELANANRKLFEEASKLNNEYNSAELDIDNYKTQIQDLQNKINDSTTSYEDACDAREQLLDIQDKLISKYGTEQGAIEDITDAINNQVSALDRLKDSEYTKLLGEYNNPDFWDNPIQNIADKINRFSYGIADWILGGEYDIPSRSDLLVREMGHVYESLRLPSNDLDILEKYSESFENIRIKAVNNGESIAVITGEIHEARNELSELYTLMENSDASQRSLNNISKIIHNLDTEISNGEEWADKLILRNKVLGNNNNLNIETQYNDYLTAQQKYKDAVIAGNEKLAQSIAIELSRIYQDIYTKYIPDGISSDERQILNYIERLSPDIDLGLAKFKDTLANELNSSLKINPQIKINDEAINQNEILIDELMEYLNDELMDAADLGVDISNTVYGNIDTAFRDRLEWTEENLAKYHDAILSWGFTPEELKDSVSTVLGSMDEFNGIQVAYSPMLETDHGLELLSRDTVNTYISSVLEQAGEDTSLENILKIDAKGFEIQGQQIRNLIADIGNTAETTSRSMHFTGVNGAIDGTVNKINRLKAEINNLGDTNESLTSNLDSTLTQTLRNAVGLSGITAETLNIMDEAVKDYGEDALRSLGYTESEITVYQNLKRILEEYDVSIKNATSDLVQFNIIDNEVQQQLKNTFNSHDVKDWIDTLTDEELSILITGKFDGKESLEDLQKWLENAKKEAESNSPILSPEFDMSALSAAGEDLKSLKSLYDQYRENIENNPTKPYLDLTEVEGLRDKLEGIVGAEDFNAFESLVTNANSSASEVEAAFNQMATAYAAAQINMQGATAKTAEMLRTQLQEWGFTKESVDQYVNAMMIAETANSSFGLSQDQAIANLQNMATQLGITDEQLAQYIIEAAQAGYIKLDGDISFLEQLVSGLGGAIDALRMYKAAFSAGGTAITKNQAEYERAKGMKKLKTDTDAASKSTDTLANSLLKMGKTATQAGKSAGGAGGAAKDAAEETSDVMSTLSGQLDEIQAAYKDLKDIMDDYNETGKISVDQAQTILTSDFRYLALLSDESGALALNEQGFVNLAQAKLNEMQITLVRNAIDTVNSLTSEAEAAKYLSNAYIELGNNALTASQQALAAAVNAAHARGAMQGAAADMIAQGAQNALSMLQNVDFSAQGMGAASGSSDSKDSSGDSSNNSTPEEVEEKYEEDFDWIERLLERLTKITEKWQKQASRFFTFWNKNWAVNQQIKSGRDEVDANKRAYTYYMKQAADVGLDVKYRDLVEKGGFSVETIENKELGEKIEKYEEWYDKAQKCKETIQDLYETEQELIKSKLDNIVDYYDTLDSYYSSIVSKIDAQIGVKAAAGQRTTIEDLLRQYAANLDYYNNARDAQLKYQMGLAINEAVTVDTAEAAIDKTRKVYVGTNAYETLTERRDELQDKLDEYNQSLQDIADTKAEIAEARKNRDAEEQKRLNVELKELQKISKSYKFTTAEKREFTSINKKLEVFSTILSDKTYYDEISEIVDNYLERIDDYTVLTEQIKELNKELRTQKDKDVRKSIQEQIKDFQKQAKEANLSGKEKTELKKLQQQLEDYDITGDTTVTRNYAQAYATQQRLLERQAEAQRLSDVLDADTQSLLQARLDKNTDDIKYYQKAVAQDKRDLNKTKLKANEEKLLKALTGQLDAIAKIQDIGVVDNLVASTATYQRLLQNIGNLQSKEKLSLAEQTKLNMYLDELAAINEGVLVDDLSSYVSNYEKWWKLNQIENKTQAQWQQFLKLDDLKTSLETAYQSYLTGLQQDLQDAIESINASTNMADLEYNKKQTEEAIRKAYADRTAAEEATIKDTTEYQTILATIKNLEDDEAALLKKGKGLSPANKAKLEKARKELEALETGATLANIKEYKKYWEYVNDDKRLARYNNGTLSAAEATTYDLYMKYLRQWDEEREEVFGDIEKELQEQLQKLDIEYDTRLNELEAEKYERLQTMYETAKTLAEAQINQYQRTIDNLNAQIENYKSIADLLSSLDLTTIRKYNINEIFDMDGNATLEELLYSKVRDAGKKSQELINDLVKQADLYQELIDAGTSEGFEGILEDYRSQASEEMQSVLDEVIKQLNENDYTDSEWITEWQQNLAEITDQIVDTIQSVQELADKMRQVTFANIQRALDMNESLVSQLSAQAGIFEDAWMRDAEGITQYGYARASILGQQMTVLQDQVRNYAEMVRKIDEAQKNEDTRYATEDDYWKARNEALVNYYNSIGSLEDVTNQIYQIGKEAQESEITNVKTIIDLRKKELSTKKALYEYDKNLKKQTKSVEDLRAQIDALNNISTADALAQKAQLEAQLAEAEESLEDLQIEHQFDLETQAFDNFIADLDKTLTDANDTVYETFEEFAATIKEILSAASGADVEGAIQNITDLLMGEGYKDPSFEAGSFSTSNGTYTPLSQSDFLTGLGFTNPSTLDANAHLSNMNDLLAQIFDNMATKITTEIEDLAKNANQNNITINQNYDSLLNVNGSIDKTVVDSVEALLRESYSYTREKLYAELQKLGIVRTY